MQHCGAPTPHDRRLARLEQHLAAQRPPTPALQHCSDESADEGKARPLASPLCWLVLPALQ